MIKLNNKKGFTLIELMIVIAIIGILAAIAIPNFISYRDKSFCSKAESDANNIASVIADYFSIPTNTVAPVANGATTFKGHVLSGSGTAQNTVTVTEAASVITIAVTDQSRRCPSIYQASNAEWSNATPGVYTKVLNPTN
jgi:prepilin-type N-terminal cleavage/methylation domain-containing protein